MEGVLEVMGAVRERSQRYLSIAISDFDALVLSLAASSLDADELIEFVAGGAVRAEALAARDHLALKDEEFRLLFVQCEVRASDKAALLERGCHEARQARLAIEAALRTTLREREQGAAWQASAVVRLAAHVAFCRRQGTGCVEAVVGGVISTDLRKLDDLRMAIEDEGLDVLSFSQSLRALASVVCSG